MPKAMLLKPVVLFWSAAKPQAVLKSVCVVLSALTPMAVLPSPCVALERENRRPRCPSIVLL